MFLPALQHGRHHHIKTTFILNEPTAIAIHSGTIQNLVYYSLLKRRWNL